MNFCHPPSPGTIPTFVYVNLFFPYQEGNLLKSRVLPEALENPSLVGGQVAMQMQESKQQKIRVEVLRMWELHFRLFAHCLRRSSVLQTQRMRLFYHMLGHRQNCAFSLRVFEMGGSGSLAEDPFCTPTDVLLMSAFPYHFL